MDGAISYGCCDKCYKKFNYKEEIIYLIEMKDKLLDLQFCNNECLNKSKIDYPYLKGFNYEISNVDEGTSIESIEQTKKIFIDLIKNYPQHIIKNNEDLISGKNNNPILLNSIELLDRIMEYAAHDFMDDHVENFLKDCVKYDLF